MSHCKLFQTIKRKGHTAPIKVLPVLKLFYSVAIYMELAGLRLIYCTLYIAL